MVDLVTLGIIGVGVIGSTHLKSLSRIKDAEIVAVADIVEEKVKKAAAEFGVKAFYLDYREMIEKEKPEAVYVLTPPFLHQEQVCFAATKGVHVFVEKPLECDLERTKEILNVLNKHRVITQVGYHWRFLDGLRKAREILLSQGGPIGLVEGRWWGGVPGVPWWRDVQRSGGQITEQATHIFDQARWLAGDVSKVYAALDTVIHKDVPNFNIEDVSITTLCFKSGALGVITSTSACVRGEVWTKVVSKNLKYEADAAKATVYWRDKSETYYNRVNAYEEEDRCFIESVRKGETTPVPIEEGFKSLELSLAAMESQKQGKPVSLPL